MNQISNVGGGGLYYIQFYAEEHYSEIIPQFAEAAFCYW